MTRADEVLNSKRLSAYNQHRAELKIRKIFRRRDLTIEVIADAIQQHVYNNLNWKRIKQNILQTRNRKTKIEPKMRTTTDKKLNQIAEEVEQATGKPNKMPSQQETKKMLDNNNQEPKSTIYKMKRQLGNVKILGPTRIKLFQKQLTSHFSLVKKDSFITKSLFAMWFPMKLIAFIPSPDTNVP